MRIIYNKKIKNYNILITSGHNKNKTEDVDLWIHNNIVIHNKTSFNLKNNVEYSDQDLYILFGVKELKTEYSDKSINEINPFEFAKNLIGNSVDKQIESFIELSNTINNAKESIKIIKLFLELHSLKGLKKDKLNFLDKVEEELILFQKNNKPTK